MRVSLLGKVNFELSFEGLGSFGRMAQLDFGRTAQLDFRTEPTGSKARGAQGPAFYMRSDEAVLSQPVLFALNKTNSQPT